MEPFEWLLLGVGVAVGSLLSGGRSKGVMRSAAKGYLLVEEKTREWTANMREDFRDAVEEARYERDLEMGLREREEAEADEDARGEEPRHEAHTSGTRTQTRSSRNTTKKRSPSRSVSGNGKTEREADTESKENS